MEASVAEGLAAGTMKVIRPGCAWMRAAPQVLAPGTDVTNIALCHCVVHACCMATAVCLRVNFKDLDKDGVPDELDNDSDNDGIDDSMQTVLKLDVDPSEMESGDLDDTENEFESYLGLRGDELEIGILSAESSNRRQMVAVYVEV
jgi:hypothetical protein